MKMDEKNRRHFICKRCGLYATREEVSDIRFKLNQRERTRDDKHDDYLEWWSKSKKEKARKLERFTMIKKKEDEIPEWLLRNSKCKFKKT